jgi:biotin carboxylase
VNELELQNGYMHLEAFVDSFGQPIICEFAWRTPGEHMLLNHSVAFNVDVYSLLIDIMIKKPVNLKLKGKKSVGDMFLPITNGIISDISSYQVLKKNKGVIAGDVTYKIGDVVEAKRQYTSCSGWVQVTGKNENEVLERMLNVYSDFYIKIK